MSCDGSLGHVSSPLNLSRLNRIVLLYGHLAGPWLCAAVYLWELELQAVCGTGFEPLLDRLADTRSILSSLFFWTLLNCALVARVGRPWRRFAWLDINQSAVRIFCILVHCFFPNRWIEGWASLYLESPVIYWAVILVVALAYFLVRQRRRRPPITRSWRFGATITNQFANCGTPGFYDLKNDPQERFNLARQEPELVDELTRDLRSQTKQSREQIVPESVATHSDEPRGYRDFHFHYFLGCG
jgi:hypothetical protein